jgi:hypothetical protein
MSFAIVSLTPGLSFSSSLRAAELAASPAAAHWAGHCEWLPGTGHCRNRDCAADCLFRPQRDAETTEIIGRRRRRRAAQQPFAGRRASR